MVKKLISESDLVIPKDVLKYIAKVINLMHNDPYYDYLDDNQCWIKIILAGVELYQSLCLDKERVKMHNEFNKNKQL